MFDEATVKRFWKYVDVRGDSECWDWLGGGSPKGYGQFNINRRPQRAHRISWMIANNRSVPDGMQIRHTCDRPSCVNPSHLLLGTNEDNVHDKCERGRQMKGEEHWNAKITTEKALEIKRELAAGRGIADVCANLSVDRPIVSNIANGRTWSWLEDEE